MKIFKTYLLSAVCTCLLMSPLGGFAQEVTATLVGTVTDNSGAVIGNAQVVVTEQQTGESRTATTNNSGNYGFTLLPPGVYTVKVSTAGFETSVVQGIQVPVNTTVRSNVALKVGQVSQTMTVTAPNPAGSATRTAARRPAENESVRQAAVPLIHQVAEAYRTVDETKKEAKKQAREAGRSIFAPLKTFSSVLWLQVTGTFFAVFAAFMGEGVWKLRANFRAPMNSPDAQKLYFHLIVFLAFAYFTVSNFVRASQRERKGRR